jgi:hypothetical protein
MIAKRQAQGSDCHEMQRAYLNADEFRFSMIDVPILFREGPK